MQYNRHRSRSGGYSRVAVLRVVLSPHLGPCSCNPRSAVDFPPLKGGWSWLRDDANREGGVSCVGIGTAFRNIKLPLNRTCLRIPGSPQECNFKHGLQSIGAHVACRPAPSHHRSPHPPFSVNCIGATTWIARSRASGRNVAAADRGGGLINDGRDTSHTTRPDWRTIRT